MIVIILLSLHQGFLLFSPHYLFVACDSHSMSLTRSDQQQQREEKDPRSTTAAASVTKVSRSKRMREEKKASNIMRLSDHGVGIHASVSPSDRQLERMREEQPSSPSHPCLSILPFSLDLIFFSIHPLFSHSRGGRESKQQT